jgi:hypothetical protein
MKSRKITEGDVADKKVASLPTRPTAPTAFGGKGYTPTELKEAFDKLALYVIERYNELIDDILGAPGESISDGIKTGISSSHTLSDLFADIKNGSFIGYAKAPSGTLAEYLAELREDVNKIASALKITL